MLFGGPSRERGISEKSGAAVVGALAASGLDVLPVEIARDGGWSLPLADAAALPTTSSPARAVAALAERPEVSHTRPVDVVFVALHGTYGEDGTVQGLLEAAGMPYTGSGVLASALAMDKERTKEVLSYHGLRTAPWVGVTAREWTDDPSAVLAKVREHVGLPAFVKPVAEGSSFGVTPVQSDEGLAPALSVALDGPRARALVERRISGVEVSCPVLGNSAGELRALPIVEVVPVDREFFDFAAKYEGMSEEICPARIPPDVAGRVSEAALLAHRVLGCDGLSRSDFLIDDDGEFWFLETNTVPGMTPESLCPLSAREAGMSFEGFCSTLVDLALQRHRSRPSTAP